MKKYTRPAIEIVELEARQNMADVNPIVVSTEEANGTVTTVYNLALLGVNSAPQGN